jgi:hypothetical protein
MNVLRSRGNVVVDNAVQGGQPYSGGGPVAAFTGDENVVGVSDLRGVVGPQLQVSDAGDDRAGLVLAAGQALAEVDELVFGAEVGTRVDQVRSEPAEGDSVEASVCAGVGDRRLVVVAEEVVEFIAGRHLPALRVLLAAHLVLEGQCLEVGLGLQSDGVGLVLGAEPAGGDAAGVRLVVADGACCTVPAASS